MSTKQNTTKEEREFQIEVLKIQMRYDFIFTQYSLFLSIEYSTFISLTIAYLTLGLSLGNHLHLNRSYFIGLSSDIDKLD